MHVPWNALNSTRRLELPSKLNAHVPIHFVSNSCKDLSEAIVITEWLPSRVPITLSASLTNKRQHVLLRRKQNNLWVHVLNLCSYQNLKYTALNISPAGGLYVIIKVLCKFMLRQQWWWLKGWKRSTDKFEAQVNVGGDERHRYEHSNSQRKMTHDV